MTPEQLDAARGREAERIWGDLPAMTEQTLATIAARLAREGWTPPEAVDPDLLAAREYMKRPDRPDEHRRIDEGAYDGHANAVAYLAGCTRGREGTTGLVEAVNKAVRVLTDTAESLPTRLLDTRDILLDALASAKRGG